jgi:Domain of unknown function (DUF5916)
MPSSSRLGAFLLAAASPFVAYQARTDQALKGDPIKITRTNGPISIDGDLSDAGWKDAARVDRWYETNPGDNVEPKVANVAYLTYDDKYFYAGFEFSDPEPGKIRAPFADRDNLSGSTDYGGVILDARHDGKTAILLLGNPVGLQYDAVSDDTNGSEDSSPDFYWDSAGRITATGWTLEMRIPFSSLRYPKGDPQTWGILLYRNYPRDFRHQFFSAKLPRGENCFICHENSLEGLAGLPSSGHLVAAPYVTAKEEGMPRDGLGTPFLNKPIQGDAGLDVKWMPNAQTAVDATLNPDFSQVESDVAQISANERFALFYPEKRPFFLEGIELFSTPIQAVYTRTITSPRWGARATGKLGSDAYTLLVAEDRGGGSVILPGSNGSNLADQDFKSLVAVGRVRHDLGASSFVSFLATDREVRGGGSNRVLGPDFQWRPSGNDTLTGQLLSSYSVTPNRPDLAAEWDGRILSSHAGDLVYLHSAKTFDIAAEYKEIGDDFRADNGFVPQVGYREGYAEAGYTFRPTGLLSRVRTFFFSDYAAETEGGLITRQLSPGVGLDGRWNSVGRFRVAFDKVRAGDQTFTRNTLVYTLQVSPSKFVSLIAIDGAIGEEVDFENARSAKDCPPQDSYACGRKGHGGRIALSGTLRPTNHLELVLNSSWRWLNVASFEGGEERRLFTAQVERLKATYNFSSKMFLRLIGQYVSVNRDLSLYPSPDGVAVKDGSFSGSALFAYKLNWQTVFFLGYGDNRTLTADDRFEQASRQYFLKVSYAFLK